jgi:hypothetical protein
MIMLRQLLDSDDALVRLAAMQSLIDAKDTSVQGNRFPDKLEIVRVRCEKPMIYVTRSGTPRIAIFNDRLGFHQPMMFTTGENRFMLRSDAGQTNAGLFYQRPGAGRAVKQDIPSNVAYLVGTMAYKPTEDSRSTPGLDMSYSDIVRVLFQLTQKQKYVDAPFVLQPDHLIEQITARRSMLDMTTGGRKESTPDRKETIPGEKEKTQAAPAAPKSRSEK